MDEDVSVLACWRVSDLPSPQPGSQRGLYCAACVAEVWARPKNLIHGLKLLCRPCAAARLVLETMSGGDTEVYPASALNEQN